MSTYYSGAQVVASEYSITASDATHLMIEGHVDPKLALKSILPCILLPVIIIPVYHVAILGILSISLGSMASTPLLIILPILVGIFVPMITVVMYVTYKKLPRTFTVELDKFSNKFSTYTPNMYAAVKSGGGYGYGGYTGAGGYAKYNRYAAFGKYLTRTWDLNDCTFRLVRPNEPAGPGFGMLRLSFRGMYLVVMQPLPNSFPVVLLATVLVERAQGMIDIMEKFVRGAPAPASIHDPQGPGAGIQEEGMLGTGEASCKYCGARNSASTRFCSTCGAEILK